MRVVRYDPAQTYRSVVEDGSVLQWNCETELGRPTAERLRGLVTAALGARIVGPGEPGQGPLLDTPGGVMDPEVYASGEVLIINNLGNLPRFALEDYLWKAGARILFNASPDLTLYRRLMAPALHGTVATLPLWFDEATFNPGPVSDALYPGRRVLLYSGRLAREKQVHRLLEVLEAVNREVEATLVLTGRFEDTPEGRAYRSLVWSEIQRRGLHSQVRFAGWLPIEDLVALYRRADLLLNLTVNPDEAFGLAQLESMACGTPVVAGAWGGLQDTIAHGRSGLLVDVLVTDRGSFVDTVQAAKQVVALLQDSARLEALARGALDQAARFTKARFLERLQGFVAAPPRPFTDPARPDEPVIDLIQRRLSQETWARLEPRLNPALGEARVGELLAQRNAPLMDAEGWSRYALVDGEQLEAFARENHRFLCGPYGNVSADEVLARIHPDAPIHALPWRVEREGDHLLIRDPLFGDLDFAPEARGRALLEAAVARPGASLEELAVELSRPPAELQEEAVGLVHAGLLTCPGAPVTASHSPEIRARPAQVEAAADHLHRVSVALASLSPEAVAAFAAELRQLALAGGTLFTLGNGGSAAIALHLAADLGMLHRRGGPVMRVHCLAGNAPLTTATANDLGYDQVFVEPLRALARPGDGVLGISGSGASPNALAAMACAQELGLRALGLLGFDGGAMLSLCDRALVVPAFDHRVIEDVHLTIAHAITASLSA